MDKIFIGIDCGVNTGFAVWNSNKKVFLELETYTFWESIERIQYYTSERNCNRIVLNSIVEDVTQNKPTFNRGQKGKIQDTISQRVGSNKRDCQLMCEFLEINLIPLIKVKPTKQSLTKLDSQQFFNLTKYPHRTSSHSRDAACLVFGR